MIERPKLELRSQSARAEHSPLGGSGAPRWMKCPGSVPLSHGLKDKESEYAELGTAAHSLAETCLQTNVDAWTYITVGSPGVGYNNLPSGIIVDKDMADAVQVYLNAVRSEHPDRNQGNSWVEREFYCPGLHEYFWGKADFVFYDEENYALYVWDYKHGAGIVVDAKENAQLMYYACGVLEDLDLWDKVEIVKMYIAQPRGFHWDGPIRSWSLLVDDLGRWLHETLIPAMDKAMTSTDTASGEHCRFCPARGRACSQIIKDYEELEMLLTKKNSAKELTNSQVGRFLDLLDVAKIAGKVHTETAFARLSAGKEIPGRKLGKARANRDWKKDAFMALQRKFGKKAYTEPKLKSPSQIEELPEGKKYTSRYAFKPDKGMTVLKASDPRPATNVNLKSLFKSKGKKK